MPWCVLACAGRRFAKRGWLSASQPGKKKPYSVGRRERKFFVLFSGLSSPFMVWLFALAGVVGGAAEIISGEVGFTHGSNKRRALSGGRGLDSNFPELTSRNGGVGCKRLRLCTHKYYIIHGSWVNCTCVELGWVGLDGFPCASRFARV